MAFDSLQVRKMARKKADENWRFRQFLKTQCELLPDEIDRRVSIATRQVWAGIDCTACANCCRQVKPSFSNQEVIRPARCLGMKRRQFIEKYLERTGADSKNPWQTRPQPCPFLIDSHCSVYEARPSNCKGYPYLYEAGFVFRMMAMIERTFTCPIVYETMEALKESLGFHHARRP